MMPPTHAADPAATTPLTYAEIETFCRRAMSTFGGDQCAYDATEYLRELATIYRVEGAPK